METTAKQPTTKQDLKRAEELMKVYAQSKANMARLAATIANEVAAYKKNIDESEKELIEIGDRNRHLFVDSNLKLEDGYLHIANNSVIETTNKFNWTEFLEQKGNLVKIEFEKDKVKKAWLDIDQHNELISFGVQVNTEKVIEVKLPKKKKS
jgi:hypothetical protein